MMETPSDVPPVSAERLGHDSAAGTPGGCFPAPGNPGSAASSSPGGHVTLQDILGPPEDSPQGPAIRPTGAPEKSGLARRPAPLSSPLGGQTPGSQFPPPTPSANSPSLPTSQKSAASRGWVPNWDAPLPPASSDAPKSTGGTPASKGPAPPFGRPPTREQSPRMSPRSVFHGLPRGIEKALRNSANRDVPPPPITPSEHRGRRSPADSRHLGAAAGLQGPADATLGDTSAKLLLLQQKEQELA